MSDSEEYYASDVDWQATAETLQAEVTRLQIAAKAEPQAIDRELLEIEMWRHQPVLSMQDGSTRGCQCSDSVFVNEVEDWGSHLAAVVIAHLSAASGIPQISERQVWQMAQFQHDFVCDSDNVPAFVEPLLGALRVAGIPFDEEPFIDGGYLLPKDLAAPPESDIEKLAELIEDAVIDGGLATNTEEGFWIIGVSAKSLAAGLAPAIRALSAQEAATEVEATRAIELAMLEYSQAIRGDWSDFDGRSERDIIEGWVEELRNPNSEHTLEWWRNRLGICPDGNGHWAGFSWGHCREDDCPISYAQDQEGKTDE